MFPLTKRFRDFLRYTERYTKTDMVYLARSGFWINLNVLIVTLCTFFLSIALANLLPASVYGTYQYLLSLATIIGALTLTGMNYAVTTAVARGNEGVFAESVSLQIKWSVVPVLISFAVAGYYLYYGNVVLGVGLLAIGILVPIINTANTYTAFLNGKKDFERAFVYSSVLNIAYYGSILFGVLYLKDALLLLLINLGINALLAFFLYVRTHIHYLPNTTKDPETLVYGKHLSFMNAITIGTRQIDTLLIFHFFGPVQLAIYTFASTVPEKVAGLFKFLFFAALPKFSVQSTASIKSGLLSKLYKVTAASILVALAYIFSAPYIFQFLFPQYMEAVLYTQVYALVIITSAGNLSLSALIAKRLSKELYIYNILSSFVLVILLSVLIWLYGLWGIVFARIISSVFDTVLGIRLILTTDSSE